MAFLRHCYDLGCCKCWGPLQVLQLECHLWQHLSPWCSPAGLLMFNVVGCSVLLLIMFWSWSCRLFCLCWLLQGILINGQFPGPEIYSVTNDNLIINVHNSLPEPFLLSWWEINKSLCFDLSNHFFLFLNLSCCCWWTIFKNTCVCICWLHSWPIKIVSFSFFCLFLS